MTTDNEMARIVRSWLEPGLTTMTDDVLDAVLDQLPATPQRRSSRPAWRTDRMNTYAKLIAAAAAVLVVAISGYQFLPGGSGSGGTNATPSPSPVLLARGNFLIRDHGRIEFEATREGAIVTGRLVMGEERGDRSFGPITVDLECTRMTEDGLIMIGGHITDPPRELSAWDRRLAAIALRRGPPVAAQVSSGDGPHWPANRTGDCLAYLDAWLMWGRTATPGWDWLRDDIRGTVEFGP